MVFNGAISGNAVSVPRPVRRPGQPPSIARARPSTRRLVPTSSSAPSWPRRIDNRCQRLALPDGPATPGARIDTWIYTGTIYLPQRSEDSRQRHAHLRQSIDDNDFLKIDGVTYINDTNWHDAVDTRAPITLCGWPAHLRCCASATAAAAPAPSGQNNSGWTGWTRASALSIVSISGTTDPMANSTNVSDYKIPIDPGDGSLFRSIPATF